MRNVLVLCLIVFFTTLPLGCYGDPDYFIRQKKNWMYFEQNGLRNSSLTVVNNSGDSLTIRGLYYHSVSEKGDSYSITLRMQGNLLTKNNRKIDFDRVKVNLCDFVMRYNDYSLLELSKMKYYDISYLYNFGDTTYSLILEKQNFDYPFITIDLSEIIDTENSIINAYGFNPCSKSG